MNSHLENMHLSKIKELESKLQYMQNKIQRWNISDNLSHFGDHQSAHDSEFKKSPICKNKLAS
jgi:hypothetical protein